MTVEDLIQKCRNICADPGDDPDLLGIAASVLGHLDVDECGWSPEDIAEFISSPSTGDHVSSAGFEMSRPDELRYAARQLLVLAETWEARQGAKT